MVKSVVCASPSMVNLRLKIMRIVHLHEQTKTAFGNLRSQIKTGLIEAEDVFASLAIPLMKLVGIKTKEMAQQGRSTTIFINNNSSTSSQVQQIFQKNASGSQTPANSQQVPAATDHLNRLLEEEERHSFRKATDAGKKLIETQRIQLKQLVYLLRGIETQVNSRQENILQKLEDNQLYLHKLFQNSILYLSSVHHKTQTDEAVLVVTVKLLRAIFQRVASALGSVQDGVEDLMTELAEHMCNPMTDYVKSLKADMSAGALFRLVALVEKMEGVVSDGQTALAEARGKVRVEEERKLEALNRLKDAQEKRKAMKEFIGFLLEAKKKSKEPFTPQQFLVTEEDQAGDEKLLWDMLREKSKIRAEASPLGTKELLHPQRHNDRRNRGENKNSARIEPRVSHRPVTRSSTKGSTKGFETPCPDPWPRLGSSPSTVGQHVAQSSSTVGQHLAHKHLSRLLPVRKGTPRR